MDINFLMTKVLQIIFVLFLFFTNSVYAKDLKCELGIGLLKPKPENKVVIDFSYDEVAFNSSKPIDVSIGKIDFGRFSEYMQAFIFSRINLHI